MSSFKMEKVALFLLLPLLACSPASGSWGNERPAPREALFIGVDVSGSFLKAKYFDDSLDFTSRYIYAHLRGLGGLEVPKALFVGQIGGDSAGEPKTFYPIEVFQNKSVGEIRETLTKMFPKTHRNHFTDFNAYFKQVASTIVNRNLILKPVSVVLLSDGEPDIPGEKGIGAYRKLSFAPLERLSRNVTIRLLYTSAPVGFRWQEKIPRRRAKVWTQDATVMAEWKDPKILLKGKPIEEQQRLLEWMSSNVDFGVRSRRVD